MQQKTPFPEAQLWEVGKRTDARIAALPVTAGPADKELV